MSIQDRLKSAEHRAVAPKNRVELLLEALPEILRIELEEVLFDMRWTHAAITRAIETEPDYAPYPEAKGIKATSVRAWRVERGIRK